MKNNKIVDKIEKLFSKNIRKGYGEFSIREYIIRTIQLRNQEIKDELKRRHCCCKREVDGQLCDGCLEIEEVFEDE